MTRTRAAELASTTLDDVAPASMVKASTVHKDSPRAAEVTAPTTLENIPKLEKKAVPPSVIATSTATSSVKALIKKHAAKHGVDPEVAYAIAYCESKDENGIPDPRAKNPNSTASGVFQFLKGSWRYYGMKYWGSLEGRDVFDAEDNVELAIRVMASERGTKDWTASRTCWGI